MKDLIYSLIIYATSLLLIFLFSIIVYFTGQFFWPENAGGNLIIDKNKALRGSYLLSQTTDSDLYFHSRPNKKIDSKCDVALYNEELRREFLKSYEESGRPHDISSFAPSASLRDPYITRRTALSQAERIAKARQMDYWKIADMIEKQVLRPAWPFFELEIVNTTKLNAELDGIKGQ